MHNSCRRNQAFLEKKRGKIKTCQSRQRKSFVPGFKNGLNFVCFKLFFLLLFSQCLGSKPPPRPSCPPGHTKGEVGNVPRGHLQGRPDRSDWFRRATGDNSSAFKPPPSTPPLQPRQHKGTRLQLSHARLFRPPSLA